ncbi:general secretion pathway protein GspN [Massilia sp. WF1]|uniref:type II secretion system protein N n=1 Tax=unclassified Massilia TaxID=2609279 RepID=UPI00068FA081|nr:MULTISPECIES: type II secretion system protein N [unclassified Massilia]ALK95261.1 general secretion pathway protein GspN [Massilia sp. WG5]KNZ67408.1 general secretion pathway protein GspN [Massilia sp. WF1]
MRRALLWVGLTALAVAVTILVFLPAAWLGPIVERQTGGRLTLGDAQGTLWHGSAFLGGAPGEGGSVTPLLPGRFSWRLSPLVLFGQVSMDLANERALALPVRITGSWSQWQVSAGELLLPAEGLAGLGAPLNTLAPSGVIKLSWNLLDIARQGQAVAVQGRTVLSLTDMGSRMSPVKPLGSYELAMDWRGQQADLSLRTVRGALLLSGSGTLQNGRLRFSGQAQAADGYEDTLGNLLNLLGQRRMVNGKNIIALEFR